jgi:predicted TIM-barrel fold metal-dependent hydrolase
MLQRNFWFCLVEEPSAMVQRHRIGIDNICFETDFPHAATPWPDSQAMVHKHFAGFPVDEVRKMTWENASKLFRHPVPEAVQRDPEAF